MDDNTGTDYMCILYSMHELDINRIISSIKTGSGTFIDNVMKSLGTVVTPANDVTFSNFNAATNGTVLPIVIAIKHK